MSEATEQPDSRHCCCADFEQLSQMLVGKVAYQNAVINTLAVELSSLRRAQQIQADVASFQIPLLLAHLSDLRLQSCDLHLVPSKAASNLGWQTDESFIAEAKSSVEALQLQSDKPCKCIVN